MCRDADDSGSMRFEENGERIKDLQSILQRVTYAATLFDNEGISVRFINSTPPTHLINGIRDDRQVETLMQSLQYKGLTLWQSRYGAGAVAFQIAQVGNDQEARAFLAKVDKDPVIGALVDCTSNYENESAEMAQLNPPVDLTPELWLVKLLLGAIDYSYDRKDEKGQTFA
ncbi:unnamed protein product, partial [Clonostachys chloroleuca]